MGNWAEGPGLSVNISAHKNRQPLGVFGAHKCKYLRNSTLPKPKQIRCFVKYPIS